MKTDELFYELFTVDPHSLFRLVQLDLEGEYTFESLTIKTTEKRLDGFCKRADGPGPNVFVEIQGYADSKIYWRALREVSTYYEQHDDQNPFVLIVLFVEAIYDPGDCPVADFVPPHRFIRANLETCLTSVGTQTGALTVLKPLLVKRKDQVFEQIADWKAEILNLDFGELKIRTLLELLEYLIVQRFPEMSRKEIESMLQLTPLEETVIGRELIQIGHRKGRQEGRQEGEKIGVIKGELIGEIRNSQKMLGQPLTPTDELAAQPFETLKAMLQQLESQL
jgi:predicted transposase YdaD